MFCSFFDSKRDYFWWQRRIEPIFLLFINNMFILFIKNSQQYPRIFQRSNISPPWKYGATNDISFKYRRINDDGLGKVLGKRKWCSRFTFFQRFDYIKETSAIVSHINLSDTLFCIILCEETVQLNICMKPHKINARRKCLERKSLNKENIQNLITITDITVWCCM